MKITHPRVPSQTFKMTPGITPSRESPYSSLSPGKTYSGYLELVSLFQLKGVTSPGCTRKIPEN